MPEGPSDQQYLNNQLLAIQNTLGSLDAKVSALKEDMDTLCSFKDEVGKIAQDFLAYKESRRDLPARLDKVERQAEDTEKTLTEHCKSTAWIAEKVAKSDLWFKAGMIAWGLIVSLVSVLLFFHKNLGITFSLK